MKPSLLQLLLDQVIALGLHVLSNGMEKILPKHHNGDASRSTLCGTLVCMSGCSTCRMHRLGHATHAYNTCTYTTDMRASAVCLLMRGHTCTLSSLHSTQHALPQCIDSRMILCGCGCAVWECTCVWCAPLLSFCYARREQPSPHTPCCCRQGSEDSIRPCAALPPISIRSASACTGSNKSWTRQSPFFSTQRAGLLCHLLNRSLLMNRTDRLRSNTASDLCAGS
jgi:hypothetical protein